MRLPLKKMNKKPPTSHDSITNPSEVSLNTYSKPSPVRKASSSETSKKEKTEKKKKKAYYSTHVSIFDGYGANSVINSQVSLSLPCREAKESGQSIAVVCANRFPDDPEYEAVIRLAECAISDGCNPELISQGSSGSYFLKDYHGNTLAVFKPRDEEPYGLANPKWGKFWQRHCCPCCFGRGCIPLNNGYISEAGASLIDERMDINIVPKTKVIMLSSKSFNYPNTRRCCVCNGVAKKVKKVSIRLLRKSPPPKIGSCQLFVHGYKDAWTWLQHFNKKPLSPEAEKDFCIEFQKLTVLDYIIRNTDRGYSNWLLKYDEKEDSSVLLAAIDNGLAFPFKHPDEWRNYPFYWALLPRAKLPYSKEIKEKFLPLLEDEEFIESIVEDLYYLFRVDKNFAHSTFEKQISVLRGQVINLTEALHEGLSPAELVLKPPITIETKISKNGEIVRRPSKRVLTGRPFFSNC